MKKILLLFLISASLVARAQTIDVGDTVIFDLSHASCIGNSFLVPVSFKSDDTVYAVDFSMKFDHLKITYNSIVSNYPGVNASAYFNPADSTLRLTSFSMLPMPHDTPVISVLFDVTVNTITEADFNTVHVYINGDTCSYSFISPLPPAVITPGGPLNLAFGDSVALSAPVGDGLTYLWSTGDTSPTIYATTPGTYSIAVTTAGGCTSFDSVTVLMSSPLPVEMINFSARETNDGVQIEWSTASEINNDFFDVERSVAGDSWFVIGKTDGAGNSTSVHHYAFVDEIPLHGIIYYRIKQVDFDGSSEYSEIVSIHFSGGNNGQSSILVFPNPISDRMNILSGKNVTFELIDLKGRLILPAHVVHANEINQINIQEVPPGNYFLRASGEEKNNPEKVVPVIVLR